jgi:N-acetylglutamate synthase-like GNAT family acetyltransferase
MGIDVREPGTPAELGLYYDLRWRILREPWTKNKEQGRDEHEDEAIHLTAWDAARIVGVGRLHFNSPEEGQVRYMAVEEDCRGRGIGGLILQELEGRARRAGAIRIVLNARADAVHFYRRHGYEQVDPSETLFDSIPHWRMRKEL